jgi:hypothetical protein
MATFDKRQLRRANAFQIAGVGQMQFFEYATEATEAEVIAAGWFNNARDQLTVGSIITAIVDCTAAKTFIRLRVTAAPATGNVTVTSNKPTFA